MDILCLITRELMIIDCGNDQKIGVLRLSGIEDISQLLRYSTCSSIV